MEVAGIEPTEVRMQMPRSALSNGSDEGKRAICQLPEMTTADRNFVSFRCSCVCFVSHEIAANRRRSVRVQLAAEIQDSPLSHPLNNHSKGSRLPQECTIGTGHRHIRRAVTGWQDPDIRAVVLQSKPQGTADTPAKRPNDRAAGSCDPWFEKQRPDCQTLRAYFAI